MRIPVCDPSDSFPDSGGVSVDAMSSFAGVATRTEKALANRGEPRNSIPVGCGDCAPAAMAYCHSKPAGEEPVGAPSALPPGGRATEQDLAVMGAVHKGKAG